MKPKKKSLIQNIFLWCRERISTYFLRFLSFGLITSSLYLFFQYNDELYINRISLFIFVIGFIGFLLERFTKSKYHPALVLNSMFVLLFFWSLELVLQTKQYNYTPADELKIAAESEGLFFDERNTLDVVRDLREANIEAYPVFNSTFWSKYDESNLPMYHIYPLGGISNVTTVYCNENGNYTIYLSGIHGFRNPIDMKINQEQNSINRNSVLVIGDSFAHGACVGTGESFPAELRKKNLRVWNFASGGLGPMSEYAILKEYGSVIQPKTILWVYYHGNDLPSLYHSTRNPILKRYLHENEFSQNLASKQDDIDFFWRNYYENYFSQRKQNETSQNMTFRQILIDTLKLSILRDRYSLVTGYSQSKKEFALNQFRKILTQAQTISKHWGGEFLFLYVPAVETLFQKYPKDADIYGFNKLEVLNILQQANIPYIDLETYLYAHPDYKTLFPFARPAHFNSLGYDYLADVVYNHTLFQKMTAKE